MKGDIADRLLQKVTLLRGTNRCSKGELTTPALIMCFVQPHNQAIPILGRFHRLYYDVRALCLYKSVDPRFIVRVSLGQLTIYLLLFSLQLTEKLKSGPPV